MKKIIKSLAIIVIALIVVTSTGCKKSSDNSSRSSLLSKAPWKYSSILASGVEDILDCEKDDVETYNANGNYTYSKGADDCSGAQDDKAGDWKLIDSNTKIVYGSTDTAIIQSLDENTLKYVASDDLNTVYILKH
jgi:hypothetical protein